MRRLLGRAPAAALAAALTTAALAAALTPTALAAALTPTAPRCGTAFATALATATLAAALATAALAQPDAAVLRRFGRVPLQRDQPVRQRPVARAGRGPDRGGCQLWDG